MQALLHRHAQNVARDFTALDESTHMLATCYGSAGCEDARARVEGLGCHMYVRNCADEPGVAFIHQQVMCAQI